MLSITKKTGHSGSYFFEKVTEHPGVTGPFQLESSVDSTSGYMQDITVYKKWNRIIHLTSRN